MKKRIVISFVVCIACILCCACGGSSDDKYADTDFVKLECSVLTSYDGDIIEGTNENNALTYTYTPENAEDVLTQYTEYLKENYTEKFDTARGYVFVDSKGNELSTRVLYSDADGYRFEVAIIKAE